MPNLIILGQSVRSVGTEIRQENGPSHAAFNGHSRRSELTELIGYILLPVSDPY